MAHLAWQYLIFIFVSSCGVLQAAAASSGLKGLLILPRRLFSFMLGVALVIGAFVWFFATESRAPAAGWPVLVGSRQVILFATGAILAFCFTVLLSSLRVWRGRKQGSPREEGLEALREVSYWQALRQRWRRG